MGDEATHSETGGVKPMSIAGRVASERERLFSMSDAERAWRAQWLKDQVLAPEEPIVPPNWYAERYNPIRRFYRAPMDLVENALRKPLGETGAGFVRHAVAKGAMMIMGSWIIWYHFKYNSSDWTRKSGFKVTKTRPAMYPNDRGYPKYKQPADSDYASFDFKNSPI